MARAQIQINGVASSNVDLPLNTQVQLSNNDDGSEQSWTWTLVPPSGSQAALSSTTSVNPTFTPDVEGSYLITLLVNQVLPPAAQLTDSAVAAVLDLKTAQRVPAYAETIETSTTQGWAGGALPGEDALQQFLLDAAADPGTRVAMNTGSGPYNVGDPVIFQGQATLKPGLPGQEIIAGFQGLPGNTPFFDYGSEHLPAVPMTGVIESLPGGGTSCSPGGLARIRVQGLLKKPLDVGMATPAFGDPVYGTSSGIALTPDVVPYFLGTIVLGAGEVQTNLGPWNITAQDSLTINGDDVPLTVGAGFTSANLETAIAGLSIAGLTLTLVGTGGAALQLSMADGQFTLGGNPATLTKLGLPAGTWGGKYWLNASPVPPTRHTVVFGTPTGPDAETSAAGFLPPGYGTLAADPVPWIATRTGVATALAVNVGDTGTASLAATLYKNGSPTTMAVDPLAGATTQGEANGPAVAFVTGDLLAVKLQATGTTGDTDATGITASVEIMLTGNN